MNKKVLAIGLLLIAFGSIGTQAVYAQIVKRPDRSPLPDAYQEYIHNLNNFYNSRKLYETNRSKYLAYKTVSAREEALSATLNMLEDARMSLIRYTELLEQNLQQQDEFNSRVKNALLSDLQTHKTFLQDTQSTLDSVATLEQATDVSNALQLRYTYLKSSATQSLTYIDAVTAKKRNDRAREIVGDFKALVAGYPSDNKNREVVEKWTEEVLPELAENENALNELIEAMYPTETQLKNPVFEQVPVIQSHKLDLVTGRLLQYSQRFKEIDQITRAAYKEL